MVILHKVGPYFVGTGPLVKAEWTLTPQCVNINKVSPPFLRPSKGRIAIPIETVQSGGRVTARGNSDFLNVRRLRGLGRVGMDLIRIIGQNLVPSKLGSVNFSE